MAIHDASHKHPQGNTPALIPEPNSLRVVWCAPDGATAVMLRGFGLRAGTADPDKLDVYRGAVGVVVLSENNATGTMAGAVAARRLREVAVKVSLSPRCAEDFRVAARVGADLATWPDVVGAANLPPWTPEDAEADVLAAEARSAEDDAFDLALATERDLTPVADEPDPWEEPIPFDAPLSLPAIPIEALPENMTEFVREVAESFEVHPDLPAACVLGIAAAASQKKYRVHVHGNHYEPTNLYMQPVLPPGERKSGVLPFVAEPLFLFEEQLQQRERVNIAQAQEVHFVEAARRESLRTKAAKGNADDRAAALKELQELAANATAPPTLPLLTIGADVTPEMLATILNQQGGKIVICDAEGGRLFSIVGGHYTNGSTNFDVLLQGHAGDPLKIHRKGSSEIIVKHPTITTVLAVQPDVVKGLAGQFRARGLAGRMLYVFPRPMAGSRKYNGQAVSDRVRGSYARAISAVLDLEPGYDKDGREVAHILKFDADAYAVQQEMSRAIDRQMLPGEPLAKMTDWGSKAPGAAARIAGILHILEHTGHKPSSVRSVRFDSKENRSLGESSSSTTHTSTATVTRTDRTKRLPGACLCGGRPEKVDVSADSVLRAWEIINCLKEHARHAYALMDSDAKGEFSREMLTWIQERRPADSTSNDGLEFNAAGKMVAFTRRACHRRFRGKGKEAPAALRGIEDLGYIRRCPPNRKPGRHAEWYEVNPKWVR